MSTPRRFHLPVRVYYEDTDFSAVVYHASYLRFLERGRTEMLRSLGVHQVDWHDAAGLPAAFVVRRMVIDWIKPARMDDVLVVETVIEECGGASFNLAQTIRRDDIILMTATVQVVFVIAGRPARLPDALRAKIAGR